MRAPLVFTVMGELWQRLTPFLMSASDKASDTLMALCPCGKWRNRFGKVT